MPEGQKASSGHALTADLKKLKEEEKRKGQKC
jgi:hypothetical protein